MDDLTPITRIEVFLDGIVNGSSVPESITRIETMLNNIIEGDVVSLMPITRIECYLAKISGADVVIPDPITRIETFLAKIAGADVETPMPITRIEWWLNEWANGGDPLTTFTGAIVRFLAKKAKPIVKLEANFTPIQSLNGQEAPWPPGGGKNKAYTSLEGGSIGGTGNIGSSTSYDAAVAKIEQGKTYTVTTDEPQLVCAFYEVEPYIGIAASYNSSRLVQANKTFVAPITGYIAFRVLTGYSTYQCEEGSTATAWTPYSNICPISGWTSADVTRTGKNLIPDGTDTNNGYVNNYYLGSGGGTTSNANYYISEYFPVLPSTVYRYSTDGTASSPAICFYDSDKNFISGVTIISGMSDPITTPATAAYARASQGKAAGRLFQFEFGNTITEYEPFGTTVTVQFGQTVYGGKLTVFEDGSGQAVVDRAEVLLPTSQSSWNDGYGGFYLTGQQDFTITSETRSKCACNILEIKTEHGTAVLGLYLVNHSIFFEGLATIGITTIAQFLTWIQDNSVKVIAPLTTPITIPLTASQINTLVGENVVFVNGSSGDITVQAYGSPIT